MRTDDDIVPPPIPEDLPSAVKFQLQMQEWSTRVLVGDARRRHDEIMESNRKVLAAVERPATAPPPPGVLGKLIGKIGNNPTAQLAMVTLLGNVTTALLGALIYGMFYVFDIPTTPTAVPTIPTSAVQTSEP